MTIFNFIYNVIIGPLKLLFESIFSIANNFFDNPGYSIIVLSIVMNFLVLPLYKKADEMQNEQKTIEQSLRPMVNHIKKTFKGDERYMMLNTLYRQNNYKPTDVLRGSVSLLLEIPFFIAAYQMLSNLSLLNGVQFGLISDLSKPDGLVKIGDISVNLLPILMTAINIVSSLIYSKGSSSKTKIQLFGMATIFLVLLYNSPSGLVFYWTLNNVFSLFKNILSNIKKSNLILYTLSFVLGLALIIYIIMNPYKDLIKNVIVYMAILALILPIIVWIVGRYGKPLFNKKAKSPKASKITFFFGCLLLALLTGLFIPSNVIKSSPEEFINNYTLSSPLNYLLSSFALAIGLFVVWFGVFYMLASEKGKRCQEALLLFMIGNAFISYFGANNSRTSLNNLLVYNIGTRYDNFVAGISLVITITVCIVLYCLWRMKSSIFKYCYLVIAIALITISSLNIYNIDKIVEPKLENLKQNSCNDTLATIPLSKNGKNVIVLMMDRAISSYVPFIFEEKPEVAKQFDGFTYYPNTISFGGATNYGAPGLYGGYEYIPKAMNSRADEKLEDKHNEALKVMPVLFDNNKYNVTVCDPSYAGYDWIPDLSIFDDYDNIRKFNTFGKFNENPKELSLKMDHILNRNFFCFSLFKISPFFSRYIIYASGSYNEPNKTVVQERNSIFTSKGLSDDFMGAYNVLKSLPSMTKIDNEGNENTFLMMSNYTAHNPMMLQEPFYEPRYEVDNTEFYNNKEERFSHNGVSLEFTNAYQIIHYQCNMAAAIKLGKWFDYMRDNGVYDNTRIIIVSDHGYALHQRDDMGLCEDVDIMQYNAFLMVKDFDSHGFEIDNSFMTNADTPSIATEGLIDNPINPFTNKPLNNGGKDDKPHYVYRGGDWNINTNNGNTFAPEQWITVEDNVFDMSQWNKVG